MEQVGKLLEIHKQHWAENGYGWWAAVDRGDDELIGWCGLGLLEETGEVEIKYLLKRSHWGRGIATEAAGVCIAYAFRDARLATIIGLAHPDNVASQRVLEKIGLHFSNRADYFGMACLRYTITEDQFDTNQR
jgi:ribosomal-protein-alanine N-acetyltransferase